MIYRKDGKLLVHPSGHLKIPAAETLQECYETSYSNYQPIGNGGICAQTFTALSSYTLSKVRVYIRNNAGSPCTTEVRLTIRPTDGGKPPMGETQDLALSVVNHLLLPSTYEWVDFVIGTPIDLVMGTKYAICMKSPDGLFDWVYNDDFVDRYAGGYMFTSTNDIVYWSEFVNNDCYFETWGH